MPLGGICAKLHGWQKYTRQCTWRAAHLPAPVGLAWTPAQPQLSALFLLCPSRSKAFQPLVDAGFLEIVYGGGPVGKYLCNHPDIASGGWGQGDERGIGLGRRRHGEAVVRRGCTMACCMNACLPATLPSNCSPLGPAAVHLTGSAATHDAIVWQGKPKQGEPPYQKPVGAELG